VLISAQSLEGPKWHQIVARNGNAAGLDVTANGIRSMKEVMDAPETLREVESGKINRVHEANARALKEKGSDAIPRGVSARSVLTRLGNCILHLNSILKDYEMPIGDALPEFMSDRLDQIEALTNQVRSVLRQRRAIK
jgi:hypothetical protein